jgi:hypothetical protein
MIDYEYPEIKKINNPEIDAEIDHVSFTHLALMYVNLTKECYETLGIDFGETNTPLTYKNRLIANPLRFGGGGGNINGEGFFDGNIPMPVGPCPFKGKSDAEKMAMVGLSNHPRGANAGTQVKAMGLIQEGVRLPDSNGGVTVPVNKYAIADLTAICNEILQLGWFKCHISNVWRPTTKLTGGWSYHCGGIAIDINPNHGCPYFNHRFEGQIAEPPNGAPPPAGNKPGYSFRIPSAYDRTCCIWSYGHPVVRIFENHGWGWGGRYGDTMHFSLIKGN